MNLLVMEKSDGWPLSLYFVQLTLAGKVFRCVSAFDIVYVLSMVLFAVRFKLFFIVLSDASLLLCEIP
jgi:hypothetical protein